MNVFRFFQGRSADTEPSDTAPSETDRAEADRPQADPTDVASLLKRYQHLRAAGRELNQEMSERVINRTSRDMFEEGAKKLGMWQRGTLFLDGEEAIIYLVDYCLYDIRRKGRNVIETYLSEPPRELNADEIECLEAQQRAVYSAFVVESSVPGVGVTFRDLVSNDRHFVIDVGFSRSAVPGAVLAARLVFYDGLVMTSGASLPIGVVPEDELDALVREIAMLLAPNKQGVVDPAPLIRECLRAGAASHIRFIDSPDDLNKLAGSLPPQSAASRLLGRRRSKSQSKKSQSSKSPSNKGPRNKVPRSAPCPCGSGKKYKSCCLYKDRAS